MSHQSLLEEAILEIKRLELDKDIVECPHCGTLYLVKDLEPHIVVHCVECCDDFTPYDHKLTGDFCPF